MQSDLVTYIWNFLELKILLKRIYMIENNEEKASPLNKRISMITNIRKMTKFGIHIA